MFSLRGKKLCVFSVLTNAHVRRDEVQRCSLTALMLIHNIQLLIYITLSTMTDIVIAF